MECEAMNSSNQVFSMAGLQPGNAEANVKTGGLNRPTKSNPDVFH